MLDSCIHRWSILSTDSFENSNTSLSVDMDKIVRDSSHKRTMETQIRSRSDQMTKRPPKKNSDDVTFSFSWTFRFLNLCRGSSIQTKCLHLVTPYIPRTDWTDWIILISRDQDSIGALYLSQTEGFPTYLPKSPLSPICSFRGGGWAGLLESIGLSTRESGKLPKHTSKQSL